MGPWSSCVHLRGRGAAPGARPRPEPAGSSSAGAAMLGCSLGLGPICLLLPCRGLLATVLTARLGRHRRSTRCLQSVHPHLLPLSGSPQAPCARPWRCACARQGSASAWLWAPRTKVVWWDPPPTSLMATQSRVMPVQGGGCCSLVSQVRVPHCYQRGPFFQRGWLAMQRAIQVVAEGWQSQEFGTKDM